MEYAVPEVDLVGISLSVNPSAFDEDWAMTSEITGTPEELIEAGGRSCYQSWSRPNPKTADIDGYIAHILETGHHSVLRHAVASFYITGVSRSFTHELVRHKMLDYSQLSQRYVSEEDARVINPKVILEDERTSRIFDEAVDKAFEAYTELVEILTAKGLARKEARQAARSVLPNATETKIMVTGNFQAWRHFIVMRASKHADVEIRFVAMEVLDRLKEVAPSVFNDFEVIELPDGSRAAKSGYSLPA